MANRQDVPGGWVDLRDPAKIPTRLNEAVIDAELALATSDAGQRVMAADMSKMTGVESARLMGLEGMRLDRDLTKARILAHVEAWSFEAPLTRDGLGDLPTDAYEAIEALVSKAQPPELNTEPNPDPASPSEPSST